MEPHGIRFETGDGARTTLFPREHPPSPCVLILFGMTGDLARRKIVPALYHLEMDGLLPAAFRVVGFSRSAEPSDTLRRSLRESLDRHARSAPVDGTVWARLAVRIQGVAGDALDPDALGRLRARVEAEEKAHGLCGNRIAYLAVPPGTCPGLIEGLRTAGLLGPPRPSGEPWTRLVIEKPFGRDLASSRALNELAAGSVPEAGIFRVDHFLAKETVQNILVFRFGNAIFEPLWNNRFVDHVQITAAEEIGIEGRGDFYETTGVLRDVVQNHLLQVLALCAMEFPVSFDAEEIRNEKTKVFRAVRRFLGEDALRRAVLARYRGYEAERGVRPGSRTATFAACKVFVDNWRWQGVPFYLRTGKRLARRRTEVSVHFRPIPVCLFGGTEACRRIAPNVLTLRIQPDEGITLDFVCKVPGQDLTVSPVTMDFAYGRAFDTVTREAYERLLLDVMRGDQTLFARRDGVELEWDIVEPLLRAWEPADGPPLPVYEPGSDGPAEADALLAGDGRLWRPLR